MKFKSSIILVLAALWGLGSWWWYTCNIKGFCSMEANVNTAKVTTPSQHKAPSAEEDSQDNDKDGIRNGDERRLGTNPDNPDSDEDGVPDLVEISQIPNDTDGDGLIDALDDDDDNDGILTKDESPDPNNDGRVDDALDSDNNGVPDYLDVNSNKSAPVEQKVEKPTNATKTKVVAEASKEIETPIVTAVVEDGSVDIYRPEAQTSAMTAEEEKRLNKGTPSPAPLLPEPPSTQTTAQTSTTPDSSAEDTLQLTSNLPIAKEPVIPSSQKASRPVTATPSPNVAPAPSSETNTPTSKETKPATSTTELKKVTDTPDESEKKSNSPSEPQDPEGKDRNKMVVYQNGKSTEDRLGPARLNFPTGVARPVLSDETADYFDTVASYLKKHKRATIKITGHTDSRGDADLNKKLALKRAEIVRDALVRRGAPEKQLQVSSMGESKPIASNNTAEGRQQNRRVDVMPLK